MSVFKDKNFAESKYVTSDRFADMKIAEKKFADVVIKLMNKKITRLEWMIIIGFALFVGSMLLAAKMFKDLDKKYKALEEKYVSSTHHPFDKMRDGDEEEGPETDEEEIEDVVMGDDEEVEEHDFALRTISN